MLFLLLNIENERYALESQEVVEILPLVVLKPVPHAPEYVAGVFNYRGQIVTVIDMCYMIQKKRCPDNLSTRIVLVNYRGNNRVGASESQTPYLLGLMAQRVVEMLQVADAELVDPVIQVDSAPYLGKMILNDQRMIQCIQIEHLLLESSQVYLLPENHNIELLETLNQ
ncbi:MAG: chemotaxis protein CheW [Chlorogloeopsis fritschii C42_A2020_084]|uniref:chemotaxis protein CheW n=1 Tax=Chlorogloeopsis fritschii TaxID=1124 RepID=UPI0019EB2514|nr:chemotaxis protein CheW [Chlorogloeopsis fritschii]MBF2006268.1 chemotaxis protein CheW [Chlorogloeopsis fritschii C42_A2020_084]